MATLETLGERITDGQAGELAEALPEPAAEPLADPNVGEAEPFDLEEFVDRVADRAGTDETAVPVYTGAVFEAVAKADEDALAGAREQLPPDFDVLFKPGELVREDAFLERVEERAGTSTDDARQATNSTLRTLSEVLTGGQAADIAPYLPPEFEGTLTESDPGEAADYSVAEFLERVADREDSDTDDVETRVRAVLSTVVEATSDREIENAKKQLPDSFGRLFEPEG